MPAELKHTRPTLHDIAIGKASPDNLGVVFSRRCLNPQIKKRLNVITHKWEPVQVPCGCCSSCNYVKQSEWVSRMTLESIPTPVHPISNVYFVTLTYDRKFLKTHPDYYSDCNCVIHKKKVLPLTLCKRHLQLFLKRLRKNLNDTTCRFYACGEYGEARLRPHYHLVIWTECSITKADIIKAWSIHGDSIGIVQCVDLVNNGTLHNIRSDSNQQDFRRKQNLFIDGVEYHSAEYVFKYVAKYVQKKSSYLRFKENPLVIDFYNRNVCDYPFTSLPNRCKPNRSRLQDTFAYHSDRTFYTQFAPSKIPYSHFSKPKLIVPYAPDEESFTLDFDEWCKCYAPFTVMSLQNPIGSSYLHSPLCRIDYNLDKHIVIGSQCLPIPRFFRRKFIEQFTSLRDISENSFSYSVTSVPCIFDSLPSPRIKDSNDVLFRPSYISSGSSGTVTLPTLDPIYKPQKIVYNRACKVYLAINNLTNSVIPYRYHSGSLDIAIPFKSYSFNEFVDLVTPDIVNLSMYKASRYERQEKLKQQEYTDICDIVKYYFPIDNPLDTALLSATDYTPTGIPCSSRFRAALDYQLNDIDQERKSKQFKYEYFKIQKQKQWLHYDSSRIPNLFES